MTYELSAIVSNNVTGDSEHVDDVLNEFGRLLRLEVGDGLDFDPLGELIDGDQEVIEPPGCLLELPDHVEAPNHEWLGDGNSLEGLGQQLTLLGIVLAPLARLDEVLSVDEGSRPVEAMFKSLPHEGAWPRVVGVDATVDVEE